MMPVAVKKNEKHQTLPLLIKDPKELIAIQKILTDLQVSPEKSPIQTLWVTFQGEKQLIGITYLKDFGCFSLTVVDFTPIKVGAKIFLFLLGIIVLVFFWNILLQKKIQQALIKNNSYQIKSLQNAKEAEIGTLIANISHQWREPLSKLSAINLLLIAQLKAGHSIDLIGLEKKCAEIENTLDFMSQTMQNFLEFYKVTTVSISFNVYESIQIILSILETKILKYDINIIILGDHELSLVGIKNEWMHIWLNIINNSLDIFIQRAIKEAIITITITSNYITFCDNGGGIKKEKISQDGLGHEMCRSITSKYRAGFVLQNTADGLCVRIEFKSTF